MTFLILRLISHPWLLNNEIVRNRINYGIRELSHFFSKKKRRDVNSYPSVGKFGVLSIATHPKYQGLGIGKLLMKNIEISARQMEFKSMRLTVHITNYKAISFYEGLGWQKRTINGKWEGYMEKDISD